MAGNELKIDILGASAAPVSETFAPFITNVFPPDVSIDRPRDTNLSFRIDDVESGVDVNSITVTLSVDGGPLITVILNGAFQSAFQGPGSNITPGGSGGFDVVIDPEANLANFKQIDWNVSGRDLALVPNSVAGSFSFFTADELPPFISNQSPAPGASDVFPGTPISFRLNDLDSPVVKASINVTVEEGGGGAVPAVVNGVIQAPFNGPSSSITTDGFDCIVTLEKTALLLDETIIEVDVQFEDAKGNAAQVTYGFDTITPLPPPPPSFPLDMYRFIISEIRRQDLQGSPLPGTEFLKRYLEGSNQIWRDIVSTTQSIPNLWSVGKIADQHLTHLKHIVGWTSDPELERITDAIDDATLRRLIAASGRLWRTRGPEDAIVNALRLITGGARMRIWNWFDFRWILDETELGEEHEGRDPWVVNLPSTVEGEALVDGGQKAFSLDGVTVHLSFGTFSPSIKPNDRFRLTSGPENGKSALVLSRTSSTKLVLQGTGIGASFPKADWEVVDESFSPDDEYRSDLRIADDGTIDRTLIKRVLRLMRGAGERWNITYLDFLDLFQVEGDDLQWQPLASGNVPVVGGLMQLVDSVSAEETFAIVPGSSIWKEYVFSSRLRGKSDLSGSRFALLFYYADSDNHYRIVIDTVDQTLKIQRVLLSVVTDLATVDLGAIAFNILPDVYYTVRATVVDEPPGHRIQVTIDGAEIASLVTSKDLIQGTIGYRHDANARVEIDEVELFQLPVDSDTLEVNTSP